MRYFILCLLWLCQHQPLLQASYLSSDHSPTNYQSITEDGSTESDTDYVALCLEMPPAEPVNKDLQEPHQGEVAS